MSNGSPGKSTDSSPEPIGRFDHIGIAVHSIDAARPFFEGVLGAKFRAAWLSETGRPCWHRGRSPLAPAAQTPFARIFWQGGLCGRTWDRHMRRRPWMVACGLMFA